MTSKSYDWDLRNSQNLSENDQKIAIFGRFFRFSQKLFIRFERKTLRFVRIHYSTSRICGFLYKIKLLSRYFIGISTRHFSGGFLDETKIFSRDFDLFEKSSKKFFREKSEKQYCQNLFFFQGRHEVVSLLLERRANMEHRAKSGLTPLMEAASGGYADVGRVLLDHGADVNAPPVPASRDTALTIAADKGHYNFCEVSSCF